MLKDGISTKSSTASPYPTSTQQTRTNHSTYCKSMTCGTQGSKAEESKWLFSIAEYRTTYKLNCAKTSPLTITVRITLGMERLLRVFFQVQILCVQVLPLTRRYTCLKSLTPSRSPSRRGFWRPLTMQCILESILST